MKNKKVLITGATEGLGFSLAKELVKKGCKVYGVGRSEDKIKKTKKQTKVFKLYVVFV